MVAVRIDFAVGTVTVVISPGVELTESTLGTSLYTASCRVFSFFSGSKKKSGEWIDSAYTY